MRSSAQDLGFNSSVAAEVSSPRELPCFIGLALHLRGLTRAGVVAPGPFCNGPTVERQVRASASLNFVLVAEVINLLQKQEDSHGWIEEPPTAV